MEVDFISLSPQTNKHNKDNNKKSKDNQESKELVKLCEKLREKWTKMKNSYFTEKDKSNMRDLLTSTHVLVKFLIGSQHAKQPLEKENKTSISFPFHFPEACTELRRVLRETKLQKNLEYEQKVIVVLVGALVPGFMDVIASRIAGCSKCNRELFLYHWPITKIHELSYPVHIIGSRDTPTTENESTRETLYNLLQALCENPYLKLSFLPFMEAEIVRFYQSYFVRMRECISHSLELGCSTLQLSWPLVNLHWKNRLAWDSRLSSSSNVSNKKCESHTSCFDGDAFQVLAIPSPTDLFHAKDTDKDTDECIVASKTTPTATTKQTISVTPKTTTLNIGFPDHAYPVETINHMLAEENVKITLSIPVKEDGEERKRQEDEEHYVETVENHFGNLLEYEYWPATTSSSSSPGSSLLPSSSDITIGTTGTLHDKKEKEEGNRPQVSAAAETVEV